MNYRHIYHAGNFADVVKHAVLALVIERLKLKPAAFRVIDTHAGLGSYDLGSVAAQKTGEWRAGIGRLVGPEAEAIPESVAPLLAPYLEVVAGLNRPGEITCYPGSPQLARALLRPQDMMVVNELHPEDAAALRGHFARDAQVKTMELDGWTALKALLPPRERRGVVLVDPPFEARGELDRLIEALQQGVRRFATGVYLMWYPIKDIEQIRSFKRALGATDIGKLLAVELMIRDNGGEQVPSGKILSGTMLSGTGLVIHNAPWQLDAALRELLPFLAERLALDHGGGWSVEVLAGDDAAQEFDQE